MNQDTSPSETPLSRAEVESLYEQHGQAVFRFLLGILKDHAAASDAWQSAWGKLIEKGHTANSSTLRSWLFQVAYREAMMEKRKNQTRRKMVERVAWWQSANGDAPTDPRGNSQGGEGVRNLIRAETVAEVQSAILELTAVQQTIVRKRIYEVLKFAEIAAELELPLGTVLSRMHTAMKRLKTVLAAGEHND